MKLIDLSTLLDPQDRDLLPPSLSAAAGVVAPRIEYQRPDEAEGKDRFCAFFGCTHEDLPDGEGWGSEVLTDMSSHCGTHVDAPMHSGSRCAGQPARTIDQIALDELYCPGVVLDLRAMVEPCGAITPAMLNEALGAAGVGDIAGHAVLLRTGQERFRIGEPGFFQYPGMTRESTLHLTGLGAKVLGTDAVGWDRPFPTMAADFRRTGDRRYLWDAHKAITECEAFIVQQLCNLEALPASGFHVGFFPIKLARTSAAPARAVAFLPDLLKTP
ncbi:cyclase family protein [Hydrogenophaga sp. ANAO-22]|jgi:kynurenine formamidase|uniref:cyclase family protein n=1 Tax=Hydrogenophaga sp. ANAO-22 TaxID=3166645 RepID=UPI0036D3D762